MRFKKIFAIIICILSLVVDESDCEKYQKLKINNVASIKKSDLPSEFSDKAFEVVDEFIKKTANLDFEILLFFDYKTGEIIKCKLGDKDNVKLKFKDNEFKGHHIASIHNHTKDMYTPPSNRNFGIFLREWEKYELIAAKDCLWILKGKYVDSDLVDELRKESSKQFLSALKYCLRRYSPLNHAYDKCDELYGKILSNYINDKNINDIQLTRRRYHDEK